MEIIERNKNYKESGIKYTRLIPMKKKTEERTKLFVNQGTHINNNIIPAHNNEEIDVKNNQNENEHNEKDINEASPLKQMKNMKKMIIFKITNFNKTIKNKIQILIMIIKMK